MDNEERDLGHEFQTWLGQQHNLIPVTGDDLLQVLFQVLLRMRSVWTRDETALLMRHLFYEIEEMIPTLEVDFQFDPEGGKHPFPTAERREEQPLLNDLLAGAEVPDTIEGLEDWDAS